MTIDCNKINLKQGSKNDNVKEVQKYLKYTGYYNAEIDGDYGNKTVTAVKAFQKAKKLVQDGNWGPLTCKASCINGCDISSSTREVKLAVFEDMISRFNKYLSEKKAEPNIIYIDLNNPYEYVTKAKYKDMLNRYDTYTKKNNRKPNIIYITPTTTTSNSNTSSTTTTTTTTGNTNNYYKNGIYHAGPYWVGNGCNKKGQCNAYYCGCCATRQQLTKLGIENYTQQKIASYAGTTTNGTSHQGIDTAIARISRETGVKLSVQWKNFSDLGSTTKERMNALGKIITDPNKAVLYHVLYRNRYGHYETIQEINMNNQTVLVLNSLGSRCSSPAYCGYNETRSWNTQLSYMGGISQKSLCIITKG